MRRTARRVLATAIAAATIAATFTTGALLAEGATASTLTAAQMLKSFNPADIISDAVMYNPSTMSASAIQTFLNDQVPTCTMSQHAGDTTPCLKDYRQTTRTISADPMCKQYTGASNETAATIIAKVAQACGVNPQALLVTLQKEQSLVTDSWPGPSQYRKATGYGCPDTTSVCDATYNGFFNQVYKAAWAYRRYTMPKGTGPGTEWDSQYNLAYPVGSSTRVLYSPNCGSTKTLTIANQATHALYVYTPYTPDAAALAAGWGTGDACSSYGNRNFFLYFTSWFGSTHYTVTGAINTAWKAAGGASGSLGNPTGNATTVAGNGGSGTVQVFQHGSVYSSSAGTYAVSGSILGRYSADGGPARLGWPKGSARSIAKSVNGGGTIQGFTKAWIYSSSHGTYAVQGSILHVYGLNTSQAGSLGWPTAEQAANTAAGGGFAQTFTGGAIYSQTAGATQPVTGAVLSEYLRRGGPGSTLGWPTGAPVKVTSKNGNGAYQLFSGGGIYARSGKPGIGVLGVMQKDYAAHGGPTGALGWPTAIAQVQASLKGGGTTQQFTSGRIYWSTSGGTHGFSMSSTEKLYIARAEASGTLGWPANGGTHSSANGGGSITDYQSGSIYASKAGTFAVRGTILTAYLEKGGSSGRLGWPKGNSSKLKDGTWRQYFVHGRIDWTTHGVAEYTYTK